MCVGVWVWVGGRVGVCGWAGGCVCVCVWRGVGDCGIATLDSYIIMVSKYPYHHYLSLAPQRK